MDDMLKKLSDIPKGSGNIDFKNAAFSLLGISGDKRNELINIIKSKGGTVCPPCGKTKYLIYNPVRAKKTKFWIKAIQRRDLEEMYLMKAELFFAWTDPEYSIVDRTFTVQISLIRHFLKYPGDWEVDRYGKVREIEQVMLNRTNKIINDFSQEERRAYLSELYFNWAHTYDNGLWFKKISFGKLSSQGKTALVSDYLMRPDIWEKADLKICRSVESYLNTNIKELMENLFDAGKYDLLCLYFDYLRKKEKTWEEEGYSDGFFVYTMVNRYIDKAIETNEREPISCLLNYKAEHYNADFIEAAQDNEMDMEFGIKTRPTAYYVKGETIRLGTYIQSNRKGALPEPIEWEVLRQDEGKVFIISKYAIETGVMEFGFNEVKWEDSNMRKWLEEVFIDRAFMEKERERIIPVINKNPGTRKWKGKAGNDTKDRVFLLNIDEAKNFFSDNGSRIRKVTPYARKRNLADNDDNCIWWLRSCGFGRNNMSYVNTDGSINDFGDLGSNVYCVCPALWLKV